ncbi:MAG: CoA transferase [Pleurocapsa minor GSE-CHR-MK-17-07R]|jgi:crotonobetainyl-CoA:carnitine CoA-transferase CaiB-like acyl-CoA transferase|nr:CoA transferase [Pleurocapsa minor GSE-CHR-MK 17-07R]
MTDSQSGALDGVRVLDFTRVLAGPFATMMLADMGAEVIKIESLHGDDTRQWGPPWFEGAGDARESAYYLSVNRNKRSITLNLKHPAAQDIAMQLAGGSQIVVENMKPGGMAAFGLDYPALHARFPALVYGSVTGYGQTGPYSDRPGYDFVIQAQSGLMSITGPEHGEPYKLGVAISDVIAGLFACSSLLAALRHAERTGHGQHVDIALLDTTLAALVNVASAALVSDRPPARYGNAHASIVPYQPFQASDKPFALAVGNDRQFGQLCALIGHPDWATDERFSSNPARVAHRDLLCAMLNEVFATRAADDWVTDLLALGIPSGPMNDVHGILHDPHVTARGLVHEVPFLGELLRLVGPPVGFSETPARVDSAPPRLGQHTRGILRDILGLRDGDIDGLIASGAAAEG